jgi:hypothetical protein
MDIRHDYGHAVTENLRLVPCFVTVHSPFAVCDGCSSKQWFGNEAVHFPPIQCRAGRSSTCTPTSPFRLVNHTDSPTWSPSLEAINGHDWDYVELHRLVGGVDVGLPAPYHMVVSRDGGVPLPILPHLRDHQMAVEFFNRCLAALLLGGVYCEAIGTDDLDSGSIIDWTYLRTHTSASGGSNRFPPARALEDGPAVGGHSSMAPRSVELSNLDTAMRIGMAWLGAISELRSEFLLKGVTGLARRDFGAALSNFVDRR